MFLEQRLSGLICPIGKVHKESICLQLKIKFPWPCLPLEFFSDENIGDNDNTVVSVMTYRGKDDSDADDDQEDLAGVRRPSDTEDIEMEEVNVSQFPPTSLKILDLNNPLRRQCINIILSP